MPQSVTLPGFGEVSYEMTAVPEGGDSQTTAVIGLMGKYAAEDASSGQVKAAVADSMAQWPNLQPEDRIFRYVRSRVKFIEDETLAKPFQRWYQDYIVETLIRPRDLLALPVPVTQGDCDDYSMLVASMLLAEGYQPVFVTVAADPRDTSQFSHVYVANYRDGRRIPIDASHGPAAGWEVPDTLIYRRQEWPIRPAVELPFDADQLRVPLLAAAAVFLLAKFFGGGKRQEPEP